MTETQRAAMRMALEALEYRTTGDPDPHIPAKVAITALRAALTEPQTVINKAYEACELLKRMGFKWYELENSWYPSAPAKPEPEPVAVRWRWPGYRWTYEDYEPECFYAPSVEVQRLYTTPPARRPLTDSEADALAHEMVKGGKSVQWLVRAIERKITGGNDE